MIALDAPSIPSVVAKLTLTPDSGPLSPEIVARNVVLPPTGTSFAPGVSTIVVTASADGSILSVAVPDTPEAVVTVSGTLVGLPSGVYASCATPSELVTAEAAFVPVDAKLPAPLGAEKSTRWLPTALPLASVTRATTVVARFGATVDGARLTATAVGTPAVNATCTLLENPPELAVTVAVPTVLVAFSVTSAMPEALVIALDAPSIPSVVAKLTLTPDSGPLSPEIVARNVVLPPTGTSFAPGVSTIVVTASADGSILSVAVPDTPEAVVTVSGTLVGLPSGVYASCATPSELVTAEAAFVPVDAKLPAPLGAEKSTRWLPTALPLASVTRATTVVARFGATVDGARLTATAVGTPAVNATCTLLENPPELAVTVAVPTVLVAFSVTSAMPEALVIALDAPSIPSVVAKLTLTPDSGPLSPEIVARNVVLPPTGTSFAPGVSTIVVTASADGSILSVAVPDTPEAVVTVSGTLVGLPSGVYASCATPSELVTAEAAFVPVDAKLPAPLGAEKSTRWLPTALPLASVTRATTVVARFGATVDGARLTATAVGTPAVNATCTLLENPPELAVTVAVPTRNELCNVTWATPDAFVIALKALSVPSVVPKLTGMPLIAPASVATVARRTVVLPPAAIVDAPDETFTADIVAAAVLTSIDAFALTPLAIRA
ncbi:hypothetical protein RM530_02830 [Algiphilus sp. W345]|uniref:Uncharacterized protein n=1 Tax=Banduia mediterranea TaxID=3075609 RepID=A0ABU2WFM0_9GAMM|nr:hypothetical protein [Algiphilus sp. W345]MDT0496303.1 hypothetical protein [Algiphilus sp. W345]